MGLSASAAAPCRSSSLSSRALAAVALSALLAQGVQSAYVERRAPYPFPAAYPSVDQTQFIDGALLKDKFITDAMAIVNKKVPANLLSIPPSTYVKESTVTYKADPKTTCYWPSDQCIRKTGGTGYASDAYTCAEANVWGLTFDDGPTSNLVNGQHVADTNAIRTQLASMQAHATFFVTGSKSFELPAELLATYQAGHQIALHTWTHHPLTSLTNEQVVAEIKYTEAIVYKTIGKICTYLRPPYGDVDDRVRAIANALGYRIALWDKDSEDAGSSTGPQSKVVDAIKAWWVPGPGFVSLEHDISTFTSQVAVDALKAAQAMGGSFPLKIQPMGFCNGHQYYQGNSTTTPAKNNATATKAAETVAAVATPTGFANQGAQSDAGVLRVTTFTVLAALVAGIAMI